MGERRAPTEGGCWVCHTGYGPEDDDMYFDLGFDTWYHLDCLREHDVLTVTEYERYCGGSAEVAHEPSD